MADHKVNDVRQMCTRVLGDQGLVKWRINADQSGGTQNETHVSVTLHGDTRIITGSGNGPVDAFFRGMKAAFGPEYHSLQTIKLSEFKLEGREGTGRSSGTGTDVQAFAQVIFTNPDGKKFEFSATHNSLTRAAFMAVLEAFIFFVNAERAFVKLREARVYALEHDKADLADGYAAQMSTLVAVVTNYADVVAAIRRRR